MKFKCIVRAAPRHQNSLLTTPVNRHTGGGAFVKFLEKKETLFFCASICVSLRISNNKREEEVITYKRDEWFLVRVFLS